MTEVAWITTKMPLYMLRRYPAEWDGRKARLFWCACMRRAWDQVTDERTRQLVASVEDRAEVEKDTFVREFDHVFRPYFDVVHRRAQSFFSDYWVLDTFLSAPPESLMSLVSEIAHRRALAASGTAMFTKPYDDVEAAEKAWQCDLIREVFGNPFRPVNVSPWLTSDVVALARGIDEERAFDRMPILADAFQDAGCDDVNVLDHCRQPREHVRGCWVVDLVLGKG